MTHLHVEFPIIAKIIYIHNISFIDFVIVSSNANTECLIKPHLTGTFNNKYFIHIHMCLKIAIGLIDGFV